MFSVPHDAVLAAGALSGSHVPIKRSDDERCLHTSERRSPSSGVVHELLFWPPTRWKLIPGFVVRIRSFLPNHSGQLNGRKNLSIQLTNGMKLSILPLYGLSPRSSLIFQVVAVDAIRVASAAVLPSFGSPGNHGAFTRGFGPCWSNCITCSRDCP